MGFWISFARLLAVAALVGVIVSPLAAPAKAGPMTVSAVMTIMADDGMECCDPSPSPANDCRDMKVCPLAALCSLKGSQTLPSAVPMQIRLALRTRMPMTVDQVLADWSVEPLGHPPKA